MRTPDGPDALSHSVRPETPSFALKWNPYQEAISGQGIYPHSRPPLPPPSLRGRHYLIQTKLREGQYVIKARTASIRAIRASDAAANRISGRPSRMAAMNRFMPTGGVL